MQLLYVWAEDFDDRIIKKGYNLSSEYIIEFLQEEKKLLVRPNPSFIPEFFGNQIIDLKAIIGKNGTGKTSLIELFLFNNMFVGKIDPTNETWDIPIFLFKQDSKFILFKRKGFEIIVGPEIEITEFNEHFSYFGKISNDTNLVYYSNLWDQKMAKMSHQGMFNISTTGLLGRSKEKLYNDPFINVSEAGCFEILETIRHIDFVINHENTDFKYIKKLPKHIVFIVVTGLGSYAEKMKFESEQTELNDSFNALMRLLKEMGNNPDFVTTLRIGFFTTLVIALNGLSQHIPELLRDIYTYLFEPLSKKTAINVILSEVTAIEKKYTNPSSSLFSAQIEKYKIFEEKVIDLQRQSIIINGSIELKAQNGLSLKEVITLYKDSIQLTPYLQFDWREMSTGEKGLLTFLSRFYYLSQESEFLDNNKVVKKDIIIFMDELELYFHPNWQKKVVSFLVKDILSIFPEHKIQFIITSHSPLLISDLPRENIIFLNDKEGIATISEPEKIEQTFGSNIHTLLSNSFFIEDGLIGDFAKEKINDLFDYLLKNQSSYQWTPQSALHVINIIGEPIIKNHLLQLYDYKFKSKIEIDFINSEIERLTAKKIQLEQNDTDRTE